MMDGFQSSFHNITSRGGKGGTYSKTILVNSYKTYGIEINQKLVNLGLKNLKRLKVKIPTIKIGTNNDKNFIFS